MSATALSDLQEIVERSIFEAIRKELVDKGYLPDITAQVETSPNTFVDKYPNTTAGRLLWETDIKAIVTSKGFAIELYSEGSNYNKGVKKTPRIVLNSGSMLPGSLGGDPSRFYSGQGASFQAKVTPPQTVDFFMDINAVAQDVEQERVLNAIMALALPRKGYIPWYNSSTEKFFVRFINYFNADNGDQGIIEKVFGYEIPDCWDRGDVIVSTEIAKMTDIEVNVNLQKYMDGSWGYIAETIEASEN